MSTGGRRRQHTVARTHLSGFADGSNHLTMRRRNLFERPVALSDATVGKDFYTFYDQAGVRDVRVETWFADDVEGPAAYARCRDVREG